MSDEPSRVMVDIETLGLDPGAAILSIGAVHFDTDGLGEEFYRSVDLQSCERAGLSIEAGTLEWWLGQDDAVQGVLTSGEDLHIVLDGFEEFAFGAGEVWAFSPSFDLAHLSHVYDAVGSARPWSYRDERDCRTLATLPAWPDLDREGHKHNALDDAKYQARQTAIALREMGVGE